MKTYVTGDIHNRATALKEVLTLSGYDKEEDQLIVLGDIYDGGEEAYEVVEELLTIKNLILLKGNHDEFVMNALLKGSYIGGWLFQGGINTVNSYLKHLNKPLIDYNEHLSQSNYNDDYYKIIPELKEFVIPVTHQELLNKALNYYVLDDYLFVHGGYNPRIPMKEQKLATLLWDRGIIDWAFNGQLKKNVNSPKPKVFWKKVFIGHTTTQSIKGTTRPMIVNNLYMLDTGAGWNGKLTIMNIETDEYWQSEEQIPLR